MPKPRAANTRKRTRIQQEKEDAIMEAALNVFSSHGFRGSTIDQIAKMAGLSKPNLLYYFRTKEAVHRRLLDILLENWLEPLRKFGESDDPLEEIRLYIRQKLLLARDFPRESRLFANEVLQGAPHIQEELQDLKILVDEKATLIRSWSKEGKIAKCDPYHLFFSIWATTQHYADFDTQIGVVMGKSGQNPARFDEASHFLENLFCDGLRIK